MDKQNRFNPLDLTNRKILVTGASSGIGRATSIYLSKLGAKLVLIARNEERLNNTLKKLDGENHISILADLAELEDMSSIFDKAVEDGIKLNGLVHCAGIPYVMPIKNLTRKRLLEAFNINYFAFMELTRQYSKNKYSDGGSIVGISSIAAERPAQCQTAYSAAKAAIDISAQALSLELIKKGIRINTVLPGMIDTEIIEKSDDIGADLESLGKGQIMGIGQPDDVASVIAFLISDMSRFITGRRFFIDGGCFL
ncbi:SDR family oxidoreductase [Tissierella sp.]|uniref:SDR family NAD(P)-dependent oxidoreductase n=1 Tax=Tissierella sp. TaxID=41274 RepID=UPI0030606C89